MYSSPESLLRNDKWRNMLSSTVYQESLVAIVVDEAHCGFMVSLLFVYLAMP